MRISVGQILVLILISFLLFGDLRNLRKNVRKFVKKFNNFLNKK